MTDIIDRASEKQKELLPGKKQLYFSNLSQPSIHEIAAAILTIRSVCKARDGRCEGCMLSIFDPYDKSHTCGLWEDAPCAWHLNAPPAKPWRAFEQLDSQK